MSSQEALDEYFDKHASHIRSDHVRMWGGKVDATRAILHPIGKQSDQVTEDSLALDDKHVNSSL